MREIKFRGLRIDGEGWVYGFYIRDEDGLPLIRVHYSVSDGPDEPGYNAFADVEVNPDTVGQYTGKQDSEGVDIYEGDIIRFTDEYESFDIGKQFTGSVAYGEGSFFLLSRKGKKQPIQLWNDGTFEHYSMELLCTENSGKVTGNIHQP